MIWELVDLLPVQVRPHVGLFVNVDTDCGGRRKEVFSDSLTDYCSYLVKKYSLVGRAVAGNSKVSPDLNISM